MKIKAFEKFGLSYVLKAVRRDALGNVVSERESSKSPNLITNSGIDLLFDSAGGTGVLVGTGSTPPAVTDTSLANFRAAIQPGGFPWARYSRADLGGNLYELVDTFTVVFAAGAASGNIAEIGLSFDGLRNPANTTVLSSRALVVDGSGNPTTFTVAADEELQLTVFATRVIDYSDKVSTITVNGIDYTVTTRPFSLTTAGAITAPFSTIDSASTVWYGVTTLASAMAGNMSSTGSGNNMTAGTFGTSANYVPGSKSRSYTIGRPAGAIATDSVGGLWLVLANAGSWQVKFNPPIPKTSLQKFTAAFSISMAPTP